jgi:Domain of unknown function (DUF4261)
MDRHIAFVTLDQPVTIDMPTIVQAIRSRYPDLPAETIAATVKPSQGAISSPLIRCGDDLVAIMNMPAPLPRDQGDAIWARAAMTWPQAPAVAERHRAHIIVSTMGKVERPLASARTVTAVVGALLDTVPGCSAVIWGGRIARSAEHWKDQSRAAFAAYPDYPVLLWVDVLPVRTAAGMDAITLGLAAFVGREIEFEAGRLNAPDVLGKTAGLAAYLVEHGDVIKDGDTFGGSEAERITITRAISSRFAGVPILRASTAGS